MSLDFSGDLIVTDLDSTAAENNLNLLRNLYRKNVELERKVKMIEQQKNQEENSHEPVKVIKINLSRLKKHFFFIRSFEFKEPESLKASMKSLITDFFANTTFHGYPILFQKNKKTWVKAMWIIFMVLSYFMFTEMLILNLYTYWQFNVLSRITYVELKRMYLPALTICLAYNNVLGIEQMLVSCKYNRTTICNSTIFEEFYLFDNKQFNKKKCYRINSSDKQSDTIYSDQIGYVNGLTLKFFLPQDDFFNYLTSDNDVLPVFDELSNVLVPGQEINLILSKSEKRKLEHPYNPCYARIQKSINYWRSYMNTTAAYRQINCMETCQLQYYRKECNFNPDATVHKNDSCLSSAQVNFSLGEKYNCEDNCRLECNSTEFSTRKEYLRTKVSTKVQNSIVAALPDTNLTGLSESDIYDRYLEMNLFYVTKTYELVSESEAMTTADLVASAGGLLGLFLGGSLLSLFEIIDLLIEFLYTIFVKRLCQSKH